MCKQGLREDHEGSGCKRKPKPLFLLVRRSQVFTVFYRICSCSRICVKIIKEVGARGIACPSLIAGVHSVFYQIYSCSRGCVKVIEAEWVQEEAQLLVFFQLWKLDLLPEFFLLQALRFTEAVDELVLSSLILFKQECFPLHARSTWVAQTGTA